MTTFPTSVEQRFEDMVVKLQQRVAVLEQQLNSQVVGTFACTSATHPTNPAVGMQIYETDTGSVLIWTGSTWVVNQLGPWTTGYVPTWTETGGSPAIGNGTINTGYAHDGHSVAGQYQYLFGSTTNFGVASQAWNFSVPITPLTPASGFWNVGTWSGLAAGLFYTGAVRMETTGVLGLFVNGSAFSVNSTNPATWTSTGYLQLDFLYRSAS